ncbi:MAG: hypothetical protein IPI81_04180 [Flavobacteriales bacterium]|nr:hypothetical protein [Flavobacteriales bacterium]MCC6937466.1 hypothetical protein [Flavobacteriales bacterium]
MDAIQVLRIERDKLAKEQRRIQLSIEELDNAIEQLSSVRGKNGSDNPLRSRHGVAVGISAPAYGGWRDFALRVLRDEGRFVRANKLVEIGLLAFPKLTEKRVKLSVRNALQGLKNEGGKAIPFRTAVGNHNIYWGLVEYWDAGLDQPRPGREPLSDEFERLDLTEASREEELNLDLG